MPNTSEARSERAKLQWKDERIRKRMCEAISKAVKGKTYEDLMGTEKALERKRKISNIQKEVQNRPDIKRRKSEDSKRLWQDPKYVANVKAGLRRAMTPEWKAKWLEAQKRRPTDIERILIEIIKQNDLPFDYVGDGKVWIGSKCPDFFDKDGKRIIEAFGVFWHTKDQVKPLKHHYKKYGYSTLILWGDEIHNRPVKTLSKIKNFVGVV